MTTDNMGKKAIRYGAIGLLVFLVLSSFGYNAYVFLKGYEFNLVQRGANAAAQQIVNAVKQKGEIELPVFENGAQNGTIFLIEKPNGTKE